MGHHGGCKAELTLELNDSKKLTSLFSDFQLIKNPTKTNKQNKTRKKTQKIQDNKPPKTVIFFPLRNSTFFLNSEKVILFIW